MKILKQTSQFKRDLKKIQNNPKKIANLEVVLRLLRETGTLPKKYSPHLYHEHQSHSLNDTTYLKGYQH